MLGYAENSESALTCNPPSIITHFKTVNLFKVLRSFRCRSKMKGVYAVILKLDHHLSLDIGKKRFDLSPGIYIYAGSAFGPGGVSARLGRHIKTFKTGATKKHWHIDFLIPHSATFVPIYASSTRKLECDFVRTLRESGFKTVDGFGNTDCRSGCGGHLVILGDMDLRSATEVVIAAFDGIGLKAELGRECLT